MYTTQLGAVILFLWLSGTWSAPVSQRKRPETKQEGEEYLRRFGHWRGSTDKLTVLAVINKGDRDDDFTKSVKALQNFAGLTVTGKLDNATKDLMAKPRCGVSDNNEKAGRRKRYVLSRRKYMSTALSYVFQNYTPDLPPFVVRSDIARALKYWSDVSQLTFYESQNNKATIKVLFGSGNHGHNDPFDGAGKVLAHAFLPPDGRTHFDEDETWTHGVYDGTNLLQVATHEFGHSLGLEHSSDRSAVMYPFYSSYISNFSLGTDDILGIQALYGKPKQSSPVLPSTSKVLNKVSTSKVPTTKPTPRRTNPTSTRGSKRKCDIIRRWLGWC